MNDEIFVIKDKFYDKLIKYGRKQSIDYFSHLEFQWKGKKIVAKTALLNHCYRAANEEVTHSKEFTEKITKRMIELANQFTWVKDKKEYSRCGKWIKKLIKNE